MPNDSELWFFFRLDEALIDSYGKSVAAVESGLGGNYHAGRFYPGDSIPPVENSWKNLRAREYACEEEGARRLALTRELAGELGSLLAAEMGAAS